MIAQAELDSRERALRRLTLRDDLYDALWQLNETPDAPDDADDAMRQLLQTATSDEPLEARRAATIPLVAALVVRDATPDDVRAGLLRCLGSMSPLAGQSPLRLAIAERSGVVPGEVVALRQVAAQLVPLLAAERVDVRCAATWALANSGLPELLAPLQEQLQREAVPTVRGALAQAIAWCDATGRGDVCRAVLSGMMRSDPDAFTRLEAALAMCWRFEGVAPADCVVQYMRYVEQRGASDTVPDPPGRRETRTPWRVVDDPHAYMTRVDAESTTARLLELLGEPLERRSADGLGGVIVRTWFPWSASTPDAASESDSDTAIVMIDISAPARPTNGVRHLTARQESVIEALIAASRSHGRDTIAESWPARQSRVPHETGAAHEWLTSCRELAARTRWTRGAADPLELVSAIAPDDDWLRPHQLVPASSSPWSATATIAPRAALVGCVVALELALRVVGQCVRDADARPVLELARNGLVTAWQHLTDAPPPRGRDTRVLHELRVHKRRPSHPALAAIATAAQIALEFAPLTAGIPHSGPLSDVLASCAHAVAAAAGENSDDANAQWAFVDRWSATFRRRLAFRDALDGLFTAVEAPALGVAPPVADDDELPTALPGTVMVFESAGADDLGALQLRSGRRIERARLQGGRA
ncbi:MAG: HEAT repeat domain-containing protein [Planctomycetota bacterium]